MHLRNTRNTKSSTCKMRLKESNIKVKLQAASINVNETRNRTPITPAPGTDHCAGPCTRCRWRRGEGFAVWHSPVCTLHRTLVRLFAQQPCTVYIYAESFCRSRRGARAARTSLRVYSVGEWREREHRDRETWSVYSGAVEFLQYGARGGAAGDFRKA